MLRSPHIITACAASLVLMHGPLATGVRAQVIDSAPRPRSDALIANYASAVVSAVPDTVVVRFRLDTTFYRKYTSAVGIPVIASALVPDEALMVTRDIIVHMLSMRPDIRAEMIRRGSRVGVMAITEMTTDIPEQRDWKKPAPGDPRLTDSERANYDKPGGIASMTDREYWNRRARGMGGTFTTGTEENVLGYPGTRYFGEHIMVHEFSHSIHQALRRVDTLLHAELEAAYREATEKKMYVHADGSRHYAINTLAEYWAEGTQWWFWNNYPATFAANGVQTPVWSPADLKQYDPKLFAVLARVYPDHRIPVDVYHGKQLRPNSGAR